MKIPEHELEISASRASGPGGQHVNKANTKIIIRFTIEKSNTLSPEQKARIKEKLHSRLTTEGDLIVTASAARSQQQNKEMALKELEKVITKALHVPKKRMKTRVSKAAQQARIEEKRHRGGIKKMRSGSYED